MTAMASNDILIKRVHCRCIIPFTLKRYVKNKTIVYSFKADEVIQYELRGTTTVKDGLYSAINRDGDKVTIKGDISDLPEFTKEIK